MINEGINVPKIKMQKIHGAQVLEAFLRALSKLSYGPVKIKVGPAGFAPTTSSSQRNVGFKDWGTP